MTNGLFTVALDFGTGVFTGPGRWLEIAVRTNGAVSFTTISPRQAITPAPYAVTAGNVTGNISAGQLSGPVPLASLPTGVLVTNGQTGVNLSGNFTGNGASVTNLLLGNISSAGVIQWPGVFTFSSLTNVGPNPNSVIAADVNGDGKPDLICANEATNTLSVLTNIGNGSFALSSTPTIGSTPFSVAAADVNGDGKVDLISANLDNTLSVLTNNGNGGFVTASTLSTETPYSLVAADVNGDGKPDLVTAGIGYGRLSIYINNGHGGFALNGYVNTGPGPAYVTAADVNGDGKIDLISANYYTNYLSVLTNDGSGGFALASSPVVERGPLAVQAVDVNGDDKLDLVSANSFSNSVSVLTNNGSGGFVLASTPAVGSFPVSVAAGDINGDGRVDLITANNNGLTLSVLTNAGSGNFVLASSPTVGGFANSVIAADLNSDGRVDLISANGYDYTLSVLLSQPVLSGNFAGSGAGLTGVNADLFDGLDSTYFLNAGNLSSGTLADGRLSANVALHNATQTFSGANTFNNSLNSFTGNGAGLTSLNGNNISSGTVADARLSGNVALLNTSQTYFGGNNFAAAQTFSGQIYQNSTDGFRQSSLGNFAIDALFSPGGRFTVLTSGNVGIGTSNPQGSLHVYSANNPTVVRIQSTGTPGFGRIEFVSNPQGDANEWRPAYIQSVDAGSFTGGLAFYVNGSGAGTKFGTNEVMRLVNGNVGIGTNAPTQRLQVNGNILASGTVTGSSDRNVKENFAPVDSREVLDRVAALPITRWNYKADSGVVHVGPMAQDFYAAFNVGMDDKHISMVDADGVALAAIQGLNQKLEQKETEMTELKQRLEKLEQLIKQRN